MLRRRVVGIVVLVIIHLTDQLWAQMWQSAGGPEGGDVMVLEQGSDGTIWAGTYMGGLYRSDDTCRSWQYVETFPAVTVNAIAVRGDSVFAGTWGAGLWRSYDGAASWSHVYPGFDHPRGAPVYNIKSVAVLGDTVWASTKNGFPIVSIDWGQTWEMRFQEMQSVEFWNPTHYIKYRGFVYATSRSHGAARTNDLGRTWEKVNTGLVDRRVDAVTLFEDRLLAGTYRGGVFRFDESEETWAAMNSGLCADSINVKALYGSGDTLFLASACLGKDTVEFLLHFLHIDSPSWTKYDIVDLVGANTPNVLLKSGQRLYGGSRGYGVCGIPTMKTHNVGISCQSVESLAENNGRVCAATFYSQVFWDSSGANGEWHSLAVGNKWLKGVDLRNDTILVAGADGVYLSASFSKPMSLLANYSSPSAWPEARSGYADAVTNHGGQVFANLDGHLQRYSFTTGSWEVVGPYRQASGKDKFFFLKSRARLFAGRAGRLTYTDNSGATWDSVLTHRYAMAMAGDSSLLLAAGNKSGIHLSFDNGTTWEEPRSVMPGIGSLAAADGIVFAGNEGGGVYVSFDTTRTWQRVNDGLRQTMVTSLALSDSMLYAGTNGASVWKLPLSEIEELRKQTQKAENYSTRYLPKRKQGGQGSTVVYDLRGRVIRRRGKSVYGSVNARLLTPGIYVIERIDGKTTEIEVRMK